MRIIRERVREAMVGFFRQGQGQTGTEARRHEGTQGAESSHRAALPTSAAVIEAPAVAEVDVVAPAAAADTQTLEAPAAPGRAIQVHRSYLVVETDDGIMIVDQPCTA